MTILDSSLVRGAGSDRLAGHDKILIVDFGSQVTQLIARRVREERVYCEIVPFQKADEAFRALRPKGVILSGGPSSVLDQGAPLAPAAIYDAGVPILGICYGEQAMAAQLGGVVEAGHHREFGRAEVLVTEDTPLFEGVWRKGERYPVWMSHGDRVTRLPEGFRVVGTSANAPIAMIADEQRKFYATQFHLEVMHTPQGAQLLRNFVLVGGLKYFYEKSGSAILIYLHELALVVLFYCLSYADQWYVNLFGFFEDKRRAHWLNRAVNFGIAVALFFATRWGVSVIVAEISHAQV